MKILRYAALFMISTFILTSCGGGSSGVAVIEGPELNLGEALQLEINQLFVKEYSGGSSRPFFAVYIQDAISEEYLVCAGTNEGLDVATAAGIFYGNLSVPMTQVTGSTDKNTPIFNIIVVVDQENPCPAPVTDNDTIVGTLQINFGELLDSPINIGNGATSVTFIGRGHEDVDMPEMDPATTDALTVGKIYFEDTPPGDIIPDYYLVLYVSNGTIFDFHAMIDPSEMPLMREPNVIYSWLNLAFSDTEEISTDQDLLKRKARIELLKNDGNLIGKTGEEFLGDIIGQTVEFTNGRGYLKFKRLSN